MTTTGSPLYMNIFNSSSGSETRFLDWRLALDGTSASANMQRFDEWSGSTIRDLNGYTEGTVYPVTGVLQSDNLTYLVEESQLGGEIPFYDGMFISLSVDAINDGAAFVKITDNAPLLKIGESLGELITLTEADLIPGKPCLFVYSSDYEVFIEVSSTSYRQLHVSGSFVNFYNYVVMLLGGKPVDSFVTMSRLDDFYLGFKQITYPEGYAKPFDGYFITADKNTGEQNHNIEIVAGNGLERSIDKSVAAEYKMWFNVPLAAVEGNGLLADNTITATNFEAKTLQNSKFSPSSITYEKRSFLDDYIFLQAWADDGVYGASGLGWYFPTDGTSTIYAWYTIPEKIYEIEFFPICIPNKTGEYLIEYGYECISPTGAVTSGSLGVEALPLVETIVSLTPLSVEVEPGSTVRMYATRDTADPYDVTVGGLVSPGFYVINNRSTLPTK